MLVDFDEMELQEMMEGNMDDYITSTKAKGMVPSFSQFCLNYHYKNNEENQQVFERILASTK